VHQLKSGGELPSAEEVIHDVEEWLRQFRDEQGGDGDRDE
jgi:hypothetical protein